MNLAQLFRALTLTRETSYFAATQAHLTGDFFCYASEVLYSVNTTINCLIVIIHSYIQLLKKKVNRSLVCVACEGQFSFHGESSVSHPEYFVHDSKSSLNHPSANKGLKISLYWRFQLTSRIEASQSNTLHSIRKVSLMRVL